MDAHLFILPSENICILLIQFVNLEIKSDERRKKADGLEKDPIRQEYEYENIFGSPTLEANSSNINLNQSVNNAVVTDNNESLILYLDSFASNITKNNIYVHGGTLVDFNITIKDDSDYQFLYYFYYRLFEATKTKNW